LGERTAASDASIAIHIRGLRKSYGDLEAVSGDGQGKGSRHD
jgi:hypothetical protein